VNINNRFYESPSLMICYELFQRWHN